MGCWQRAGSVGDTSFVVILRTARERGEACAPLARCGRRPSPGVGVSTSPATLLPLTREVVCDGERWQPEAGLLYLKPVQTGFPSDSDARLVSNVAGLHNHLGRHAAAAANVEFDPAALQAPSSGAWRAGYTSFAWGLAASPHLAVEREGDETPAQRHPPSDTRPAYGCSTARIVRAQRRRKHEGGPPASSATAATLWLNVTTARDRARAAYCVRLREPGAVLAGRPTHDWSHAAPRRGSGVVSA